jgi:hypothetical protein
MALLSRSDRVVATEDENGDGRVDARDDTIAAHRVAAGEPSTMTRPAGRAQVDERLATQRRLEERTGAAQAASSATTTMPVVDTSESTMVTPARVGPRPRSSLLATASLIFGVGGALAVMTGVLAGPGIALGIVAAFLGIGGIAATSRRHVAGKADALFGVVLGLAAIVVGSLALTGTLGWLDGNTNEVVRVHDWLSGQLPWLFPTR